MTEALTITEQPSAAQLARRNAAPPGKVGGRLKRALDIMVFEGTTDNEAAVQTGMTVTAIRLALKRPHVRSYYHAQLDVLRTRESARNLHALIDVRDQKQNHNARVAAVKAMENVEQQQAHGSRAQQLPGFVIVVQNNTTHMPHMRETEAKPLIEQETGSQAAIPDRNDKP